MGEACGAGQPGIVAPAPPLLWNARRSNRGRARRPLTLGTALPSLALAHLQHAILCLRSGWTKSSEQIRRDSVSTALNSSVALTRNRRRWACELSSSSKPSQARWGVRVLAAGAPRGMAGMPPRPSTQTIGGKADRPGRAQEQCGPCEKAAVVPRPRLAAAIPGEQ